MDIIISLILLVVVLTPLGIVVRDLWPALDAPRARTRAPTPTPVKAFPSLSVLEDLQDTMPACLRRAEWERPEAWATDPGSDTAGDHPEEKATFARRR